MREEIINDLSEEKEMSEEKRKRGRRSEKNDVREIINKDQTKFCIDLSKDEKNLQMLFNLLEGANQKAMGREITFRDLVLYALSKLTPKDIEKLKDDSLSEMDKVQRVLDEYNQKNGANLSLGEFLVKKLNIA